jgi:DNA-binding IclR family transcriptional regulator
VTLAALTVLVPVSRITPERRSAILSDLSTLGEALSESVAWLPSFSARRA